MDGVISDAEFNIEQLKWIINAYKNIIERFSKVPFPQDPNEQLLGAIKKVLAGGRYISTQVADQMAAELQQPQDKLPHQLLSDREYQILCFIASGKSVSDIAEILPLSVKTISTYRTRLLKKMGIKHNAEVTRYAIEHGLVD